MIRYIEGVPYQRYVVRFRLADGRIRRWIRWSVAGTMYVYGEVGREFYERLGEHGVKAGSCTITPHPLT